MNLILETIKSLIRKVENLAKVNAAEIGKVSKRLSGVSDTANAALKTAKKAQTSADDALASASETIYLSNNRVSGTLPIEKGGTGASTRTAAREALGIFFENYVEIQTTYDSRDNSYLVYSSSDFNKLRQIGNLVMIVFNAGCSSDVGYIKLILNSNKNKQVWIRPGSTGSIKIVSPKKYLAYVSSNSGDIYSVELLNY